MGTFKVVKGKKQSLEWTLMIKKDSDFSLGVHFDKKFSQKKIDIIKKHLDAACLELNELEKIHNGH